MYINQFKFICLSPLIFEDHTIYNPERETYQQDNIVNILNEIRLKSKLEVLLEDHITLENDQITSLSIVSDFPTYIRIKIIDYFPIKMMAKTGPFNCTCYLSFTTLFPNQQDYKYYYKLKQCSTIQINKPQGKVDYLYGCILSSYSTAIKMKVWFQKTPELYERLSYNDNSNNYRYRSLSTQPNYKLYSQVSNNRKYHSIDQPIESKQNYTQSYQIKCQAVKLKKFQLESNKLIKNYQHVLSIIQRGISPRSKFKESKKWKVLIYLLILVDAIHQNFKLNLILKYMVKKNKVYAWKWFCKFRRNRISSQLSERTLLQNNLTFRSYSSIIYQQVIIKAENIIKITIQDSKIVHSQNVLNFKLTNFYKKILRIQIFYKQQKKGFKLRILQMIRNYQKQSSDPLFTRQRLRLVVDNYYKYLCQQHKIKFKQYLNNNQNNNSLLTEVLIEIKRPKLEIIQNEQKLIQIIQQFK